MAGGNRASERPSPCSFLARNRRTRCRNNVSISYGQRLSTWNLKD